ncbi:HMG1/2-like protein [Scaptodrosophila lebanonensis]|uniref:HMG1/2-like protein n=1 Tax=Drosophila lebanonensis TaxID=7225 RepID=A0A6J2UH39_DROLE|nr:HMG1/2-like protein [Scaptodrosophila lebanonensis]
MARCGAVRKKGPSCSSTKKATCQRCSKSSSISSFKGRNPFILFLHEFRKQQKAKNCDLSAPELAEMAGRKWRCMSRAERLPYINAASRNNYIYRSRCKQVNWGVDLLREAVGGTNTKLEFLYALSEGIMRMRDSVEEKLLKIKDKNDEEEEEEENERICEKMDIENEEQPCTANVKIKQE